MKEYAQERKLAREIGVQTRHVCLVGSTLICGKGNDADFLCLLPSEDVLPGLGFAPDLEVEYESPLRSYRRDGINLIATTEPNFYFAEVAIAHAARAVANSAFDMSLREDRIRFHSEVRAQVLARLSDDPFDFEGILP